MQAKNIFQFTVQFIFLSFTLGFCGLFCKLQAQNTLTWQQTYNQIGVYKKANLLDSALVVAQKAVEQAQTAFGNRHENYMVSLFEVATLCEMQQRYTLGLVPINQAVALYKELYKQEDARFFDYISLQIRIWQLTNDHDEAEKLCSTYLKIAEKNFGKVSKSYTTLLALQANNYQTRKDFIKAERCLTELLPLREQLHGKLSFEYSSSTYNLGVLYQRTGRFSKAEKLYLNVLAVREQLFGTNHKSLRYPLEGLSGLYNNTGRAAEGKKYALRYVELAAKQFGQKTQSYAAALYVWADCEKYLGNYAVADCLMQVTTQIHKEVLGEENGFYASCLSTTAGIYMIQKDRRAEKLYKKSEEIINTIYGKKHESSMGRSQHLAIYYALMGEYKEAKKRYLKILAATSKKIDNYFPHLNEEDKKDFYFNTKGIFDDFNDFAIQYYEKDKKLAVQLFEMQLKTKSLLLHTSNKMRDRILRSENDSLITLYKNYQKRKDDYAQASKMKVAELQKAGYNLEKLLDTLQKQEKQLALLSEDFARHAEKRNYSWQAIRRQLKKGEAIIEIIRVAREKIRFRPEKDTLYVALLITPHTRKAPKLIVLPEGNKLEMTYYKEYKNRINYFLQDTNSYKRYWLPLAKELKDIKKVYFTPDGIYHKVNLNTLKNPQTGNFLIQDIDIQLLTNSKDLLLSANAKANKPTATAQNSQDKNYKTSNSTAFLVGYPDYTLSDDKVVKLLEKAEQENKLNNRSTGKETRNFTNVITELVGTKKEIEQIGQLLRQNNYEVSTCLQRNATEDTIKTVHNPTILHIATHGFFNQVSTDKDNPLFRSGLLLSGAALYITEDSLSVMGKEDGILTAYESMSLDLDETDLVVLSACETGLGALTDGEGVYGLQRAFLVAGAKQVLSSLWKVDDTKTQELMNLFYDNLQKTTNKRIAFRQAQQTLRQKYPQPYYWGAFVMMGGE